MAKKWKIMIAALLALAVLALGGWLLGRYIYDHADHGKNLDGAAIAEYNTAITDAARKAGTISETEFILIGAISKESGGNTNITVRVYALPEGADQADYMSLRFTDLPEDFVPEHMANGIARLVDDSMDKIYVTVNYVR